MSTPDGREEVPRRWRLSFSRSSHDTENQRPERGRRIANADRRVHQPGRFRQPAILVVEQLENRLARGNLFSRFLRDEDASAVIDAFLNPLPPGTERLA